MKSITDVASLDNLSETSGKKEISRASTCKHAPVQNRGLGPTLEVRNPAIKAEKKLASKVY